MDAPSARPPLTPAPHPTSAPPGACRNPCTERSSRPCQGQPSRLAMVCVCFDGGLGHVAPVAAAAAAASDGDGHIGQPSAPRPGPGGAARARGAMTRNRAARAARPAGARRCAPLAHPRAPANWATSPRRRDSAGSQLEVPTAPAAPDRAKLQVDGRHVGPDHWHGAGLSHGHDCHDPAGWPRAPRPADRPACGHVGSTP
jgi:hypothetical protein